VALGQILEENVTVSTESHYDVNTYYTKIKKGHLVSPDTDLPLVLSFKNDTELDYTEIIFFTKYEAWAINPDTTGTAIWVSPPHQDHEGDDTKVIAFKKIILDGQSAILNRSVNLKMEGNDFLNLGHDMIRYSTEPGRIIFDPEILRGELIVLEDNDMWINIVEKYTNDYALIKKIKSDEDIIERHQKLGRAETYIQMIELGYSDFEIVKQMKIDNFINPAGGATCDFSSTQTVSKFFEKYSIKYESQNGGRKYVKNCGSCGAKIEKEIPAGYICPRCKGIYEGC
jgi:hypothetical protein